MKGDHQGDVIMQQAGGERISVTLPDAADKIIVCHGTPVVSLIAIASRQDGITRIAVDAQAATRNLRMSRNRRCSTMFPNETPNRICAAQISQ